MSDQPFPSAPGDLRVGRVDDHVLVIGDFALNAVISAMQAVIIAVLYCDLRVHTEGVDGDRIAAVFD